MREGRGRDERRQRAVSLAHSLLVVVELVVTLEMVALVDGPVLLVVAAGPVTVVSVTVEDETELLLVDELVLEVVTLEPVTLELDVVGNRVDVTI